MRSDSLNIDLTMLYANVTSSIKQKVVSSVSLSISCRLVPHTPDQHIQILHVQRAAHE